jgi:hypothetical protein
MTTKQRISRGKQFQELAEELKALNIEVDQLPGGDINKILDQGRTSRLERIQLAKQLLTQHRADHDAQR